MGILYTFKHKATLSSNKSYKVLIIFLLIVVFISYRTKKHPCFRTHGCFYNLMRDKYETKAYTQSNDTYPFPTPYNYRTTSCTSLNHLGECTRLRAIHCSSFHMLVRHYCNFNVSWRIRS